MEKEKIIDCIDEVFNLFDEELKKQLSGKYNVLNLEWARTWTQWMRTALYKKIALQDNK